MMMMMKYSQTKRCSSMFDVNLGKVANEDIDGAPRLTQDLCSVCLWMDQRNLGVGRLENTREYIKKRYALLHNGNDILTKEERAYNGLTVRRKGRWWYEKKSDRGGSIDLRRIYRRCWLRLDVASKCTR